MMNESVDTNEEGKSPQHPYESPFEIGSASVDGSEPSSPQSTSPGPPTQRSLSFDQATQFQESPSAIDRIKRGISKQYSTVTGRQHIHKDEESFQYARKSTLLEETPNQSPRRSVSQQPPTFLTSVDLDTIEKLDADYERALLQREIGWNARYISVRQNAGLSLWFFSLFLLVGIIFFHIFTDWTYAESILFTVYTVTTVGYGNHIIPNDPPVLIFISFYIFIGIALLTILAAQLYQWVVLEVTWAQYERDSKNFLQKHQQAKKNAEQLETTMGEMPTNGETFVLEEKRLSCSDYCFENGLKLINWTQAYTKNNPAGQLMVVLVPFSTLIILGAVVVGSIQGWDIHESLYFAIVSMTTVGFGDYFPDKLASTWFCIFWLPFSVAFVSLYLGSVAHLYLDMSNRNIKRIEAKLRRRINMAKQAEEQERAEARARMTSGGFGLDVHSSFENEDDDNNLSPSHLMKPSHLNRQRRKRKGQKGFSTIHASVSSPPVGSFEDGDDFDEVHGEERRESILANSQPNKPDDVEENNEETMKSLRDVIAAVKITMATPRRKQEALSSPQQDKSTEQALSVKSTIHYNTAHGVEKKPSFALRVLLQERFCHIIAREIAGYQSHVSIKNNTLSVTIDSLKYTADKWEVPRRARKPFRSVAFEVLYFVGERALIVRGADAIFDLRPHEAQDLFAPLLAAFGDADTMEAWLMRTETLATEEFANISSEEQIGRRDEIMNRVKAMREQKITHNLTASTNMKRNAIGNAVNNSKSHGN